MYYCTYIISSYLVIVIYDVLLCTCKIQILSEHDCLLIELKQNRNYITALEEELKKRDDANQKHDQGIQVSQRMITEATTDEKEKSKSLHVCAHLYSTYVAMQVI